MKKTYPNVLLVSHNSFSDSKNNGKTLASLFEGWDKNNLAQLYFNPEKPNGNVCNNFFRITEEMILKRKKSEVGDILFLENDCSDNFQEIIGLSSRKYKPPIFFTVREIIWETQKWKNDKLENWLESVNPSVIFFVGGGSAFSYNIVNYISNKFDLPVILYFTDDYMYEIDQWKFIDRFNNTLFKRAFKKVLLKTKMIFTIGEEMANEYKMEFNKETVPLMNSIELNNYKFNESRYDLPNNSNKKKLKIGFFGSLHSNRDKTVSKLINTIKAYNQKNKSSFTLDIFTQDNLTSEQLKQYNQPSICEYKGAVGKDEIIKKMYEYDLLLHIESFDKKAIKATRLSISTKIPEYLATGIPILAIGPSSVASIKYIKDLNLSFVINDIGEINLLNQLKYIQENINIFTQKSSFSKEIVLGKHSKIKNHEILLKNISLYSK